MRPTKGARVINLYMLFAQVLGRNNISFEELRRNRQTTEAVARLMRREIQLTRGEFEWLVTSIAEALAKRESAEIQNDSYNDPIPVPGGRRIRPLPNLGEQESRPDGRTSARFGKWPKD